MQIRPFPWRSLFLAPFASVPALTLAGLGSSGAGTAYDFGWAVFFGLLLAVPTSFMGMLLIGVPIFLMLRHRERALMLATVVAGFAIPFFIFFGSAPSSAIWGAVASGLAVAATAFLLRPRNA